MLLCCISFPAIPHESAFQWYAAQNNQLAIKDFCGGLIMCMQRHEQFLTIPQAYSGVAMLNTVTESKIADHA